MDGKVINGILNYGASTCVRETLRKDDVKAMIVPPSSQSGSWGEKESLYSSNYYPNQFVNRARLQLH